ncbi:50S ribosomal protein L18 [Candidatus Woesebacteria bacterium]|nr:50S ribosomal protein L18 [Candidatus Woesebacteria bacterium]
MRKVSHKHTIVQKRILRVRAKLAGTVERPRVTVSRSNRYIHVQVIDDVNALTIAAGSDLQKGGNGKKVTKTDSAKLVAAEVATQLKKKKITAVVFDRGPYKYHGRVKAVAESLREQGITV